MVDGEIKDINPGDDVDVIRTVTGLPSGQTVISASMAIYEGHALEDPLVVKTITATEAAAGVLTNPTSGTAVLTFRLAGANTGLFLDSATYIYYIVVTTNTGKIKTVDRGRLTTP